MGGRAGTMERRTAVLLGILGLLYGVQAFLRATNVDYIELKRHRLPGVELELPDWTVAKRQAEPSGPGHLSCVHEDAGGRWLCELRWNPGTSSGQEVEDIFSAMGFKIRKRDPFRVGGHDASLIRLLGGKEQNIPGLLVTWVCPEDDRTYFLNLIRVINEDEENLRLLARIVATVRCHAGGAASPAKRTYPAFSPPPGFRLEEDAANALRRYIHDGDGSVIVSEKGMPGRKLHDDLTANPEMIEVVLKTSGFRNIRRSGKTVESKGGDGHARKFIKCTCEQEGVGKLVALTAAWHCDKADCSYAVTYYMPPEVDMRQAMKTLGAFRCH